MVAVGQEDRKQANTGDQSIELSDRARPPSPFKIELEGKSTYDKLLKCDERIIETRRDRDKAEKSGEWEKAHGSQLELEALQRVRQEIHPQIQLRKKQSEKVKLERKLANAKKTKHYLQINDIVKKIDQKKKEVENYRKQYDDYKRDEGKASKWKAAMNWCCPLSDHQVESSFFGASFAGSSIIKITHTRYTCSK